MTRLARGFIALVVVVAASAGAEAIAHSPVADAAPASGPPRFSHVVEVFLENETATATWENAADAPNLQKVRAMGAYIPNFF
ncbi:MAG: hypothetical protein JO148_14630, partial [Acidimicrobiia bacterium]|nr:hypothetical protein [Acidimicrobiia bacterium]